MNWLGFDLDDDTPRPNRAERRKAQQQYRREARAANKAWQARKDNREKI